MINKEEITLLKNQMFDDLVNNCSLELLEKVESDIKHKIELIKTNEAMDSIIKIEDSGDLLEGVEKFIQLEEIMITLNSLIEHKRSANALDALN
jgi:hypothetical protein